MPAKKFTWDEGVLTPDSIIVPFPPEEEGGALVEITFYELSRPNLLKYVDDSKKLKVFKELKETEDVDDEEHPGQKITRPKRERLPISKVEAEHAEFMFTWLAIMCRQAKSAEWFGQQPLTGSMLGKLADMMYTVNHLEEVIASSGNWLMLPTIQRMFNDLTENAAKSESGNLQPISEA